MKTIHIQVDDRTYDRAKHQAVHERTTLAAMLRACLVSYLDAVGADWSRSDDADEKSEG